MPDKTTNTGPTPGLLQRLFGSSPMTPEIQSGIDIARKENPSIGNVDTYGPISRLLYPNAQGYTSPGKSIYLNPDQLQGFSPQEVADTIAHEQTHVTQMQGRNPISQYFHQMSEGSTPYYQRPDELAAFQTEKDRRAKMGRMPTAVPAFDDGHGYVPLDTILSNPKRKQ